MPHASPGTFLLPQRIHFHAPTPCPTPSPQHSRHHGPSPGISLQVPRKLDDDAALLRAWVLGGEKAREEERRRIAHRTPEDLETEAAERAAGAAAATVRLERAKLALQAAAEEALRVEVALTFEPPPLGRAEVPRVPRHFSGASRLGQGDGKAFVNAYADPDRGLRLLIGACDGDTRVAEAMHDALVALVHNVL
jgi:kinesin family protein 2/24